MRLSSGAILLASVSILAVACDGQFVVYELEPDAAMGTIVRLTQRSRRLEQRVRSLLAQLERLERERQWAEAARSRGDAPLCRCETSDRRDGEPADATADTRDEDEQHAPEPSASSTPVPHVLSLPPISSDHHELDATSLLSSSPPLSLEDPPVAPGETNGSAVSRNTVAVAVVLIVAPAAVFLGLACLCRRRVRHRRHHA